MSLERKGDSLPLDLKFLGIKDENVTKVELVQCDPWILEWRFSLTLGFQASGKS